MSITKPRSSRAHSNIGRFIEERNLRGPIEIFIIILVAILVAILVRTFLLQFVYIPSESMNPYLEKGDKVFINQLSYSFHDVARGDVIVFDAPDGIKKESEEKHKLNPQAFPKIDKLIKRVIAKPGETIEGKCSDDQSACAVDIYIDGKKLNEPYLSSDVIYAPFGPYKVPEGEYFVMGDNRNDSEDSRFPQVGTIPKGDIVGRAFFRLWPLSRFGFLS